MQRGKRYIGIIILITIFLNTKLMAQDLYFSTPQESVKITSKLLIEENWEKLSNYYFLHNADVVTIDSLKNGSYFIRDTRPELFHPGVQWKYKKPFPPNFSYFSHIETSQDTVKVEVNIEIDQGNGMLQQGISSFYLIKSDKGYQHVL